MKAKAVQNTVNGWVKNLKDGRVEAVLEGNVENVGLMIDWCHRGPANAIVEDVIIHQDASDDLLDSFEVRY